MGSKWEIEKFTGKNDFGLWKVKVRAILTQQKCVEALLGISNMPNTLSNAEKSEMNDKALSVIILCLADNVLREVAKEKTAAAMWTKLDALYMTKSLAHKQCLKERLFFFRMVENKPVVEQLSEFNKIIDDLANIDVNLEDEDKAFHLLCALPKSLENLKDALLYGKEVEKFYVTRWKTWWIYRFKALVEESRFEVEVHQSGMAMKTLCGSNGDQAW
ncbi:unnamed protein product [Trifolium pratense]|uniref:Uncharacterized protein n=1 Tax=Trifolium pratense TaxID=57577 RepID=A0ACB0IDT8_TRIPR|nr:unnamed protein product [Trifolium pratense]